MDCHLCGASQGSNQAKGPRITFSSRKGLLVQGHLARPSPCCHIGPGSRAEIDHLSALLDVSARMLGPGVRRVQACSRRCCVAVLPMAFGPEADS